MTILNSIAQRKILDILSVLEEKTDVQLDLEKDLFMSVMNQVADVVRTSGLPEIKTQEIVNPAETEITSEYFNTLQKEAYDAVTYYRDILVQLGSEINKIIDVISEYLDSNTKMMDQQKQELKKIEQLVLTKLNNASILNETNLLFETLKTENLVVSNVRITPNGNVSLPLANTQSANVSIKSITFKVISPIVAEKPISFISNVNGKANDKAVIPGFFEGKMYGRFDLPIDIRLSSNVNQMVDNRDDTKWECEYISDNPLTSSFQVLVVIEFSSRQILNYIGLQTSANDRIYFIDALGNKVYLSGKNSEYFSIFDGRFLYLELTENTSKQIEYHLDAIIKNEYTVHTYNIMETLSRHLGEVYTAAFPTVKISPVRALEEQTKPEDIKQQLLKDKYRLAITTNKLSVNRNSYLQAGVLETIDTEIAGEIYGVEIQVDSWIPDTLIEWIKYSVSFDSGKTWSRIRPVTDAATNFNINIPSRIQLEDTVPSTGTQILSVRSKKVRMKIEMASNDSAVSPLIYNFRMRIKER